MSQHTGSHKNSLNLLGEKYLNESHWPMHRISLLECTSCQYQLCMQSFITIVHSVWPFSLFQNLELGTASTDVKRHFAISWARFSNPSV